MFSLPKRAVNKIIRHGHWFNEVQFADCKKFWQCEQNLDVINLGSTNGLYCFCYEGLPVRGANLALHHNLPLGDLAILKNYSGYLNPEKATVLLPLCPFYTMAAWRDTWFDDRYYTFLNPMTISNFSYQRFQQIKRIRENPVRYIPMADMLLDILYLIRGKKKNRSPTENDLEVHAANMMDGWMKGSEIDDFSNPLSFLNRHCIKKAVELISEMADFCIARNISFVLLIPPMYRSLAEKFSPQVKNLLFGSVIAEAEKKAMRFFDYTDDPRFSTDASLFQDSFCMNSVGAKRFTRCVLEDCGIIPRS